LPYAVAKPRVGYFRLHAQAMMGCLLVVLTIFTVSLRYQHALFRNPLLQQSQLFRAIVHEFAPAQEQVIAEPSAYEMERTMTQSQLLDRWQPLIDEASQRFAVPKSWIRAVIQRESAGRTLEGENQPITSPVGAIGLMQLMPATYRQISRKYDLGADATNPHDNIIAGTAYLSWLKQRYGFPSMFGAYNYGPGNFQRFLNDPHKTLPRETADYIQAIATTLAKG